MSDPPVSDAEDFIPSLTLSEIEIQMLAKLAAKDLDGFMQHAVAEWAYIQRKAGTAIAKAIILSGDNLIPECKSELKTMLILSFRARALESLLKHVANDPQLRKTLVHDDAQIERVLETCIRQNLALKKQFEAEQPA